MTISNYMQLFFLLWAAIGGVNLLLADYRREISVSEHAVKVIIPCVINIVLFFYVMSGS